MKYQTLIMLVIGIAFCSCNLKTSSEKKHTHEITDMIGRKVKVPEHISRVFCSDMATTIFAYSLLPEKLVGINNKLPQKAQDYLTPQFCSLPALGSIFLANSSINLEELMQLQIEILLCPIFPFTKQTDIDKYEQIGQKLGAAVVCINLDLRELNSTYYFMGKLLQCETKASKFASYCEQTIALADSISSTITNPLSVYIAEGENGLRTIPHNSTHSEIFKLVGLNNCAKLGEKYGYSDMSINAEQLLIWDPDYIIKSNRSHHTKLVDMQKSAVWKPLSAIKNKKVLTAPCQPFNWVGRPPSINRLIGVKWLMYKFHSEKINISINEEIKQFYKLFYHVQVDDATIDSWMH
ncbi:ABC transporter substrate-binding protein [Saccharicrinis aurantiacus]|uniref:ABC transporter substrate-binding protein n=1 Tax=Saccharicrinis aurantiacus TaxID=1849719 RepID=UPI00249217F7|nr:ABC transporter substrate-binding protein [Saccharicrinis aurantiacus]